MAIIYVNSATGNDANSGLTPALAKLTLKGAHDIIADGDVINLKRPGDALFEDWGGVGYIQWNKAGLVAGIDIISDDPDNPARIGGLSGTFSVRVATSGYRFHYVDFCSGADTNTTIFGCNKTTAINDIVLNNCRIIARHDISSSSAYCMNIGGTGGIHDRWYVNDLKLIANCPLINGIQSNAAGLVMQRVTANLPIWSSQIGLRLVAGAANTTVIDSEFSGSIGLLQSAFTSSADLKLIRTKLTGRTIAASFLGTSSGTLYLLTKDVECVGLDIGFSISGSNVLHEMLNLDSGSSNTAIGSPADGAFTNVESHMEGGQSVAWGDTVGHSLLIGAGSVRSSVNNHCSSAHRGGYPLVVKGSGGVITNSVFQGGTLNSMLMKGAVDWRIYGNTILCTSGGDAIDIRNGDTTPIASGNDIRDNEFIVTNGALFNIGVSPGQEDGTSVLDGNHYQVIGSGTWGTIKGTAVTSLATAQAAWVAAGNTNDSESLAGTRSTVAQADAVLGAAEVSPIRSDLRLYGGSALGAGNALPASLLDADAVATGARQAIAAETATQLATSHGAGSWEGGVGASGGGPVPLTVTVTSGGDPLAGVIVYILDSAGDPLDKWLPTNASGQCVFGLAAGDYQIGIGTLSGYTMPAPVAKTLVAATAATETIALTAQTTDPPDAAGLCVIDDYVLDGSKQPVVGAEVAALPSSDAVLLDVGVATQVRSKAITDANGRFTLQLVRADAMSAGSTYTIEIRQDAKSIFRTITGPIPNAVSATLNDIEAGA